MTPTQPMAEVMYPGNERQQSALAARIQRMPARHREDALQDAWVAYLSASADGRAKYASRDANRAVATSEKREARHEERETCLSQLSSNELQQIGDEI